MKDFLIIDSDGEELFDAMSEKFKTKVVSICGNQFYKVELQTSNDYFNGGVYCEKADAEREVKRLYRTLEQFKQGKLKGVDAFKFADSEISALELLNLFELYSELDTATKLRGARMSAAVDSIDEVENFLDKLRLSNLQKGGV